MLSSVSQHCYAKACVIILIGSAHREILLNQTEIRLYLQFSDWLETKRTYVWFQINWKMINTIWFLFDLIRFLCVYIPTDKNCFVLKFNKITVSSFSVESLKNPVLIRKDDDLFNHYASHMLRGFKFWQKGFGRTDQSCKSTSSSHFWSTILLHRVSFWRYCFETLNYVGWEYSTVKRFTVCWFEILKCSDRLYSMLV